MSFTLTIIRYTYNGTNLNSTSSNFGADDIIYWTISGVALNLLGGDSVEIKVLHEAAAGADCATDAFFRMVAFEYV